MAFLTHCLRQRWLLQCRDQSDQAQHQCDVCSAKPESDISKLNIIHTLVGKMFYGKITVRKT